MRTLPKLVRCPYRIGDWHCPTDLQAVSFEGRLLLSAGVASHLQTVHGMGMQSAWHVANATVGGDG